MNREGPCGGQDPGRGGGHCKVELEEFTKTYYSQCCVPILTCTVLNPQHSMQSLMHGWIFLGRGSVILIRPSLGCVAPRM